MSETFELRELTLAQVLDRQCALRRDKLFLTELWTGRRWTYGEIDRLALRRPCLDFAGEVDRAGQQAPREAVKCSDLGAMSSFLWTRPPQPDDADNDLRLVSMSPMPKYAAEFEKRFGLRATSNYGLSDFRHRHRLRARVSRRQDGFNRQGAPQLRAEGGGRRRRLRVRAE